MTQIDHLLIIVEDLEAAVADFTALGFTVKERADTKHGGTAFRFIPFDDGSYILLTSFTSPEAAKAHRLGPVLAEAEGWGDYSFVVPDLEAAIARARTAGVTLGKVNDVRNVLATGETWALRLLVSGHGSGGDTALPFIVEDVEGRAARIPAATPHANGVTGVVAITIAAADPAQTAARLGALIDLAGWTADGAGGVSAQLGAVTLRVVPNAAALPGHRGFGGLASVTLATTQGGRRTLDLVRAHGATIELVP